MWEKFKKYDGLLVLVDLEGGSPYNVASEYFYTKEYENKIEIVSGVNFSALVEAVEGAEERNLKELVEEVIASGAEGIKKVQIGVNGIKKALEYYCDNKK